VLALLNRTRMLMIRLQRSDEWHRIFHQHAVEAQHPANETLCVKIRERRLKAPIRLDATQLTGQQSQKTSTDKIEAALETLLNNHAPDQDRAALAEPYLAAFLPNRDPFQNLTDLSISRLRSKP
jgi:hypothetical protein